MKKAIAVLAAHRLIDSSPRRFLLSLENENILNLGEHSAMREVSDPTCSL